MEQAFVVSVPALMEHLLYTGYCVKGFVWEVQAPLTYRWLM